MAVRPMRGIWRVKPIDLIMKQSDESETGLKRTLTAFSVRADCEPAMDHDRSLHRVAGNRAGDLLSIQPTQQPSAKRRNGASTRCISEQG